MARPPVATPPEAALVRPRLGFLGVGWIGRHRMQAILEAGMAEVAAIADPSPETAAEAGGWPRARSWSTLDDLLDMGWTGW
jgi:predicted dehydrogenase